MKNSYGAAYGAQCSSALTLCLMNEKCQFKDIYANN